MFTVTSTRSVTRTVDGAGAQSQGTWGVSGCIYCPPTLVEILYEREVLRSPTLQIHTLQSRGPKEPCFNTQKAMAG
jgi:hypothetical protein